MTYRKLSVWCFGVVLAGWPIACMDLDGYHPKSEVAARGGGGGGPPAGSGGTARGGSAGTGTCEDEEFTLYNNAVDYEATSSSCTGYSMYAAVYLVDTVDSEWLLSGYDTTRYVPFGSQWELQVQCCWLDLEACSSLTTICDVYGLSYACTCNPVMTFRLTADTCPGETVDLCP